MFYDKIGRATGEQELDEISFRARELQELIKNNKYVSRITITKDIDIEIDVSLFKKIMCGIVECNYSMFWSGYSYENRHKGICYKTHSKDKLDIDNN